ncbi:MAG: zinc-dependent metalloprotease [Acidimicrobiia bacterium]|nr:zinc-dependent metalloprotease [Acidimicrobiia bacterium]
MGDVPQPGEPDPTGPGARGPGWPFSLEGFDLGQMLQALRSEGPLNWEVARQVAGWVALGDRPEPTIDPTDRDHLVELAHAAQTLVVAETGLAATFAAQVETVTPLGWTRLHLEALRPVLEALASTLHRSMVELEDQVPGAEEPDLGEHPLLAGLGLGGASLAGLLGTMAPLLLGVQAGSMVGYLAQHALGRYDLPLPAADEPSLCFVVPNLDDFEQAWSLPRADLRFYVAVHEVVHAAERSVPWLRERLVGLATRYVAGYEIDPGAFEAELGDLDPADPSSFAAVTEHPERLLGAMQSPGQREVLAELQVLMAVIEGYADSVLARIGDRMIPSFARIHEAMTRHRLERGEAERFIEGLLGLRLEREHYEQGEAFCRGVAERAGPEALNRLWEREEMLPTPSELEAPGLWLARIELPDP